MALNHGSRPADHTGMSKIRNLPLAVRLAGAFGALTAALVLVAFTGVQSMHGLSGRATDLANRDLTAARLLGDARAASKQGVSLAEQHLYLHDGELATEDRLARQIKADDAASLRVAAAVRSWFADAEHHGLGADDYTAVLAEILGR
jgi:hypothetical protein